MTSQRHDITSTLIAIQCDSLCTNCQFLKRGLVDHIGVLQTPIMGLGMICLTVFSGLQDRISRKDELLQGYEKDLAKLQQAETLANKRGNQVDSLTVSVKLITDYQ